MSSFFDYWGQLAVWCAEQRVAPGLACQMHRQRLAQAQAYFAWVTQRRDAKTLIPAADPALYKDVPLLRLYWQYAAHLEQMIGALPRDQGLFGWAGAALDRLAALTPDQLYGPEGTDPRADFTPWSLWASFVIEALHTFGHFVGQQTARRYGDNPYAYHRRIPNWVDADKWGEDNGFPRPR